MTKERVVTDRGPAAIGPYSQAIVSGDMVFVSGQIPLDPASGVMVTGDVAAQTERVMKNLSGILEAAGSSMARVVKTTVYLASLADFETMNRTYAKYFEGTEPPARATVEVSKLPKGALVEIDAIALRGK